MRRTLVIAVAMLTCSGIAVADAPVPFHQGSGTSSPAQGGRDVLWSQPADLRGDKNSSEIIAPFGITSETATDFVIDCDGPATISTASWWGGEWGTYPGYPSWTEFNLLFYENDPTDCKPIGEPFSVLVSVTPARTDLGYDVNRMETYFRYDQPISLVITGGQRYWFVAQAASHDYPPQWGRQEAVDWIDCDAYFRSVEFGWPDWTRTRDVTGLLLDASQEFAGYCGGVPVTKSTWGSIRALYR